eukprot:COSAG04_NODE_747_length_10615_cov_4.568372_9_plen_369_part_00
MASAAKRARVVLRTPAEALEANLEAQRAQRDKIKELQAAMDALRREEAEIRGRTGMGPVAIGDLPEPALRAILLTATTHDNLLRFVAACARVCAEWRRVVGGSAAYGLGLPREQHEDLPRWLQYDGDEDERARALRVISRALEADGEELDVRSERLSDEGAAALGAALQAMPRIRFTELDLRNNDLTAAGVASLAPALRRPWSDGLEDLDLCDNPLGDAGVAGLAKALPPTLETLTLSETGCGDDGLVALVAALSALTRLETLVFKSNPATTARGWAALVGALPSLVRQGRGLDALALDNNPGMGSENAAALAAAIPGMIWTEDSPFGNWAWKRGLRFVSVGGCQLDAETTAALKALRLAGGDYVQVE